MPNGLTNEARAAGNEDDTGGGSHWEGKGEKEGGKRYRVNQRTSEQGFDGGTELDLSQVVRTHK